MPGFLPTLLRLARAAYNRRQVIALGELDDHLCATSGLSGRTSSPPWPSPATAIPRGC
jgi:hypothetical protein